MDADLSLITQEAAAFTDSLGDISSSAKQTNPLASREEWLPNLWWTTSPLAGIRKQGRKWGRDETGGEIPLRGACTGEAKMVQDTVLLKYTRTEAR